MSEQIAIRTLLFLRIYKYSSEATEVKIVSHHFIVLRSKVKHKCGHGRNNVFRSNPLITF